MSEYKYPVKYAVLEVRETGGWSNNYEDLIRGYIVSKCYVIESKERFYKDGNSKVSYKVLFPYKDISIYKMSINRGNTYLGDRLVPRLDACDNIYDTEVVSNVFDTKEEALILKDQLNIDLRKKCFNIFWLQSHVWKEKVEEFKKSFDFELDMCNRYEAEIEKQTEDFILEDGVKMLVLK